MAFYFAWVDSTDTTFSVAHQVEDEEVISFELNHSEGDFATLAVDVVNPRVGLLNPSRKQWAWFSTSYNVSTVTPLFFGRLIGIPEDIHKEAVRLMFIARPMDYETQRLALAETLKVRPYYDPIWLSKERREDPDAVLDARSALWHIDRTSHVVTVSDVITGEDGTIIFNPDDVIENSVSVRPQSPPARAVTLTADVEWEQRVKGTLDLTNSIVAAFKAAGSEGDHKITSYTGEGLLEDWPTPGANIGGGWSVDKSSEFIRLDGKYQEQTVTEIDLSYLQANQPDGSSDIFHNQFVTTGEPLIGYIPLWSFRPEFIVEYEARRSYKETISFTLEADMQSIITEPGDDEVIRISFASAQVGEPIDGDPLITPGVNTPIGDLRRRQYYTTERGHQSVEYLIEYARAQLLGRARAISVSFSIPLHEAYSLSCRKSATLSDARLPGGLATGKITSYYMRGDGDTGLFEAGVTIGVACGEGNTVSASAGSPDYVEADYVESDYQVYLNEVIVPGAGDVTYTDYDNTPPDDDGLDFLNLKAQDAIVRIDIYGGQTEQQQVINYTAGLPGATLQTVVDAVNDVYTEVELCLVPLVKEPFETTYSLTVSDLMVPKLIDLSAAAP